MGSPSSQLARSASNGRMKISFLMSRMRMKRRAPEGTLLSILLSYNNACSVNLMLGIDYLHDVCTAVQVAQVEFNTS